MVGLYIRELVMSADARRGLIVAPGGLVEQLNYELHDQSDRIRKATEHRCDKLEQKFADLRRNVMHRDSEVAQLRLDIAVLASRRVVPLLGASASPDRPGWFARWFGR
jgi:hypothetical protein